MKTLTGDVHSGVNEKQKLWYNICSHLLLGGSFKPSAPIFVSVLILHLHIGSLGFLTVEDLSTDNLRGYIYSYILLI